LESIAISQESGFVPADMGFVTRLESFAASWPPECENYSRDDDATGAEAEIGKIGQK